MALTRHPRGSLSEPKLSAGQDLSTPHHQAVQVEGDTPLHNSTFVAAKNALALGKGWAPRQEVHSKWGAPGLCPHVHMSEGQGDTWPWPMCNAGHGEREP